MKAKTSNRDKQNQKPRLLILTDIGGDPDDQQSMIRLMLYSNEFEIEGLIASASGTPGELGGSVTRPDLIKEIVNAYGKVRRSLIKHSEGYPTEEYLLERIKSGNKYRKLDHIGKGHDTEGSEWIISTVDKDDQCPLNIGIWGGQTDLAQALWKVKNTRGKEEFEEFISKIRVHDIADQDGLFGWLMREFLGIFYILDSADESADKRDGAYRGIYLGGDESLTSREWVDTHVRNGHGPLGALYPDKTWTAPNPHGVMKEGDTPSWFYFYENGLNRPGDPTAGGWGGRFIAADNYYRDAADTVGEVTNARATVWRWRPAFQNDFQARMDWCVKPYNEANHNPIARIKGNLDINVPSDAKVTLDASESSDPDNRRLAYSWLYYPEAGTYEGEIRIEGSNTEYAEINAPEVKKPETIHIILTVTNDGEPMLTGYRRMIITVVPE